MATTLDTQELTQKFEAFKQVFMSINKRFVEKLTDQLTGPQNLVHKPEVFTPNNAAKLMVGKKKLLILSGLGLSLERGISELQNLDDPNRRFKKSYFGMDTSR